MFLFSGFQLPTLNSQLQPTTTLPLFSIFKNQYKDPPEFPFQEGLSPQVPHKFHCVKGLRLEFACAYGIGEFKYAIGERGLSMIDVCDDAEIADVV